MSSPWTAGPATRTYAAEIQSEWSPYHQTPLRSGTGITEPGLAEIKPHKAAAIRKGLQQLRDYLQRMQGSAPVRRSVWLITYLPWPSNTNSPSHLRVFAHKVKREDLLKKGPLPSLDALTLSRRELPRVPLPKYIAFPSLARPDMFGLAVEPIVRDIFARQYQRPRTHEDPAGTHGADVLWREMSDHFRALGDETGDSYWRELAEELVKES